MDYPLATRLLAEFLGTAILLILGNGSVAAVSLKGSKEFHAGWIVIVIGYACGVMFPCLMFGGISGSHINPAMTIGQAINGMFPWNEVLPYIIAQILGAVVGQLIVVLCYLPYYKQTEDVDAVFGTFSTNDAANNKFNYFVNEFVGTLVLVLCALCSLSLPWGKANLAAGAITVGLVCGALVAALGGPTGPALNPARDLMPRLLHQILPLPHKGSSHWTESWIPVVAPICGAIVGVPLFKLFI
ncbi:MIP/aquaporin family protein [Pseudoscardovia suis]